MLDRQQKACQLAQHQAEQQSRAAALQQQQQQEQQQQHQATAEPLAHGQVTAEALAAAGQHAHSTADEAALQAEAKEAVKVCWTSMLAAGHQHLVLGGRFRFCTGTAVLACKHAETCCATQLALSQQQARSGCTIGDIGSWGC
jgi:hypothetical protein